LRSGETVVDAVRPIVIQTAGIKALCAKNDAVLIDREKHLVDLKMLYDTHSSSTVILIGNRAITLSPGQEFIIAANTDILAQRISTDGILRRRFHVFHLNSELACIVCDYSPSSLAAKSQLLHLIASGPEPEEKRLAHNIERMAACLALATANDGDFIAVNP